MERLRSTVRAAAVGSVGRGKNMIASMGGLIVDAENNRKIPGSGGMIGGYTPTKRNVAWIAGAGEVYNQFTPSADGGRREVELFDPIDPPIDSGGGDPIYTGPVDPPTGGTPTTPTTGTTKTGEPIKLPPIVETTITKLLEGVGFTRTAGGNQPLYLYTPAQPQAENASGGVNMRSILMLAAVGAVGYFLYKRFA